MASTILASAISAWTCQPQPKTPIPAKPAQKAFIRDRTESRPVAQSGQASRENRKAPEDCRTPGRRLVGGNLWGAPDLWRFGFGSPARPYSPTAFSAASRAPSVEVADVASPFLAAV